MIWVTALVFWASVSYSSGYSKEFPSDFKFGVSTSDYQVEGAWNVSGKGEHKWDRLVHRYPEKIANRSNGDDACKSYDLWERDIEMLEELGVQFYRFSISWARILPSGFPNKINEDGVKYYNDLIDGLVEKGIEPAITLHHSTTPQIIQDLGGWANPYIADWFADYARLAYSLFGDRVKIWFTINEPLMECDLYYGTILEPELDYLLGPYVCSKNILLAHAKAWRVYDNEFRKTQKGKVAIVNNVMGMLPYSSDDEQLAQDAAQFLTGRYSYPIYSKEGGWPPVVEKTIAKVSEELGFKQSRLPPLSREEIDLIKGTYDFYAMNHYSCKLVRRPYDGENVTKDFLTYIHDLDAVLVGSSNWTYSSNNLAILPEGIRTQLHWLKNEYGDVDILISENGLATEGSNLSDDNRVSFIRGYLDKVLQAISEGVKVIGYSYWSLMDNFEWADGYGSKFGLYQVNFTDSNRTRTQRMSAVFYADLINNRTLS